MTDAQALVQEISSELRARQPLPALCPAAAWSRDLSRRIAAAELPPAVASALLLWNDDLDASHALSQGLPDPFGNWLHGTMHRREGDFSNSKYWFGRVGTHAGFMQMSRRAAATVAAAAEAGAQPAPALAALAARWDPFAFVDLCANAAAGRGAGYEAVLESLQAAELELLTELAT